MKVNYQDRLHIGDAPQRCGMRSSTRNREAIHRTHAMVMSHFVTMFTRLAARSAGEFIDGKIRRWRAGCTLDSFSRSVWKLIRDAIGAAGRTTAQPGGAHRLPADLEERRERERAVGQGIDRLRAGGAQVFHDVRGDGCRLDHVIISRRGVFVVETRALPKPWPKAKPPGRPTSARRSRAHLGCWSSCRRHRCCCPACPHKPGRSRRSAR